VIRDRHTKFTNRFDAVFAADDVEVIKAPPQAPPANAICERAVGTLRRECLDHMLIFGARPLQGALDEYLGALQPHRPHRSLSKRPPWTNQDGKTTLLTLASDIPREQRLLTVESGYELALHHFTDRHHEVVALEAREANVENAGRPTCLDLVRWGDADEWPPGRR
jgi:hypothetical protein